jgi:hypothetical protein
MTSSERDRLFHFAQGVGGAEPSVAQARAAEALHQAGLACQNTEAAWLRSLENLHAAIVDAHAVGISVRDVIPLATQPNGAGMGGVSRQKLRVMVRHIYSSRKEIKGEK